MDSVHNKIITSERVTQLLWAAAILAAAVGILLALKTDKEIREGHLRLARAHDNIAALGLMKAERQRYLQARQLFSTLAGSETVELKAVLSSALPAAKIEDRRETYEELADGGRVRRQEISLNEAPLAGVMAFVQNAERCRPPWRLVKALIRGSSSAGAGSVSLTFEVVENL